MDQNFTPRAACYSPSPPPASTFGQATYNPIYRDTNPPTCLPFNNMGSVANSDRPSGVSDLSSDLSYNMSLYQQPLTVSSINDYPPTDVPPPTSNLPPPTSNVPPPTSSVPPPTSSVPPPTSSVPPPTSTIQSPLNHEGDHIVTGLSQSASIKEQYKPQPTNSEATNVLDNGTGNTGLIDTNLPVTPASNQSSSNRQQNVKVETFKNSCRELHELLQVEETSRALTSNLIAAGIISLSCPVSLLPNDIQSLLHQSPCHYTAILDEMRKIESLQGVVNKMERLSMMEYTNHIHALNLPLQPVLSQQDVLSQIIVDIQQLTAFLGEKGDNTITKYRTLNTKFNHLLMVANKAFQNIPTDNLKFLICSLLSESKQLTDKYHVDIASPHHSMASSTLLFLKRNGFLNVWNIEILSDIVSILIKDDKVLVDSLEEYRQEHDTFFRENLHDLAPVFKRVYVERQIPSDLLEFGFHLNDSCPLRSGQQWRDEYNNFRWSKYTAITKIDIGSIIIMYIALPCVVSAVIKDLTDPVIITHLQSIGVTIILPKDTISNRPIPVASEEIESSQHTREGVLPSLKEQAIDRPTPNDDELNAHLLLAVRFKKVTKVTKLLKEGANPNVSQYFKDIPLIIAIKEECADIVSVLLDYGAHSTCTNSYGKRPLHVACESGNSDIVKLLITKGKADIIHAVDKYNKTPLFYGIESGNTEVVNILLTNGARTDVVDRDGNTLLDVAVCRSNNSDIVELLKSKTGVIDRGSLAETYIVDYSKYSDVSRYGKPSLIEMLNWIVAEDPGIWNEVGSALGISDGHLNGIKMDLSHGGTPKLMFKDVLVMWERSRSKPYNWHTILQVLDSPFVDRRSLAEKVAGNLDKKAK